MELVPLNKIFDIQYGNQFDFNKLEVGDRDKINFVTRSSQNLGVVAKVLKYNNVEPFEAGLITVTLGGTYLLSSFIQQNKFYTAQNVKVLRPKRNLNLNEKLFYCKAIEANRFRYTSHGREANTTLNELLVPKSIPANFLKPVLDGFNQIDPKSILKKQASLNISTWEYFKLDDLFKVNYGVNLELNRMTIKDTGIPFVSRTSNNNGVSDYVEELIDISPNPENTISVSGGGSVLECFLQEKPYYSGRDLYYLTPKFEANKHRLLFIITILRREKYRFNYGRQANKTLKHLIIRLPINKNGEPNYQFMEDYIKSLPYSSSI